MRPTAHSLHTTNHLAPNHCSNPARPKAGLARTLNSCRCLCPCLWVSPCLCHIPSATIPCSNLLSRAIPLVLCLRLYLLSGFAVGHAATRCPLPPHPLRVTGSVESTSVGQFRAKCPFPPHLRHASLLHLPSLVDRVQMLLIILSSGRGLRRGWLLRRQGRWHVPRFARG